MSNITSRKILFDIQAQTLELRKSTADVKELTKELKYAQVGEQKRRDELQQNIKYEKERKEALERSIIALRNEQQALNASNISNIKLTQTLRLYSRSITAAVPVMEKLTTSVLAFNYAITTGAGPIGIIIGALTVLVTVGRLLTEWFDTLREKQRNLSAQIQETIDKFKEFSGIAQDIKDLDIKAMETEQKNLQNRLAQQEKIVQLQKEELTTVAQNDMRTGLLLRNLYNEEKIRIEIAKQLDRLNSKLMIVNEFQGRSTQSLKEEVDEYRTMYELGYVLNQLELQRYEILQQIINQREEEAKKNKDARDYEQELLDYIRDRNIANAEAAVRIELLKDKYDDLKRVQQTLVWGTKEYLTNLKEIDATVKEIRQTEIEIAKQRDAIMTEFNKLLDKMSTEAKKKLNLAEFITLPQNYKAEEEEDPVEQERLRQAGVTDVYVKALETRRAATEFNAHAQQELWKAESEYQTKVQEASYGKMGAKVQQYGQVASDVLGSMAGMWEQGTAEWKAFASAQAAINGALAIQTIWSQQGVEFFSTTTAKTVLTAAVAAMTAANIAKIASTPIPQSKLSNSSSSAGGGYSYSAPAINPVRYLQQGTQNVSMNANTANLAQATPQTVLQVYVREQDIRSAGTKSSVIENGLRY
ncbi:MAG: hypothetical protein MdMp024_0032 [Bacteroidales bacterium]